MAVTTIPLEDVEILEGEREGTGVHGPKIRCPKCDWRPTASDLWTCKCGHEWHTFDTGGVCPGCIEQWPSTQCHSCKGWSAHSDWYEYS